MRFEIGTWEGREITKKEIHGTMRLCLFVISEITISLHSEKTITIVFFTVGVNNNHRLKGITNFERDKLLVIELLQVHTTYKEEYKEYK